MRFLFECVGCCTMNHPTTNVSSSSEPEPTSPSSSETRSLVTTPARSNRRKKRNSGGSGAADWRPSLFAISEDNAVQVMPEKKQTRPTTASQRNVKGRCGPSSVRVNARSQSRDFGRHDPLPMVVPAFSAAPFMF